MPVVYNGARDIQMLQFSCRREPAVERSFPQAFLQIDVVGSRTVHHRDFREQGEISI